MARSAPGRTERDPIPLSPSVKLDLLAYIEGIGTYLKSEGSDLRQVAPMLRKALRMQAAAENGFCPWCGLVANHTPTRTCTGVEA